MNAYERLIDALHAAGKTVNANEDRAKAQCPAHDDHTPSLSLTRIRGTVLVYCHAGCAKDDVLSALSLAGRDLYDDPRGVEYDYSDNRKVHRGPGKTFRQSGSTRGKALYRVEKIADTGTVYVTEGEQDVDAIESAGGAAVCNAGGAGKAHLADWSPLRGKHVVIVADRDEPGRNHASDIAERIDGVAKSIRIVEAAIGKDSADHVAAGLGLNDFMPHVSPLLADLVTAADLDGQQFNPLVQHVPGIIAEGFGILAGPPKLGKSWFANSVALSCSQGGMALDAIPVKPRHVLLLALEDGHRRLQTRMRLLNGDDPLPKNLEILTNVSQGMVIATITEWLRLHATDDNPPLVILDTLGKARPQRRSGEDAYIADYQLGTRIKRTVDAIPGSAIVAIHHTRKMAANDFVDTVAGTQGITGSADYVLVLARKRKSNLGTLAVTGRDITEEEYALVVENGLWRVDGGNLDVAAEKAETRREQDKLGDRALEVLSFVNGRTVTRAADLASLGIPQDQARVYLNRLADSERIRKTGRGLYGPVSYVTSVTNGAEKENNETEITNITPSLRGDSSRCRHCGDFLAHPDSIARGYCSKRDCLLVSGTGESR